MATYNPVAKASFSSTPYSYVPLLTSGDDVITQPGTVASGLGVMKRGTILQWDPATGVIIVPATAPVANCILVDDIDATSATVPAKVYTSGKFNAAAVIWPGALSHALVTDALRNVTILLEGAVWTDGTLVKGAPKEGEQAGGQAVVESNRSETESRRKGAKAEEAEPVKPSIDSPYAYLTAEEREKSPELAAVPTATELTEAAGALPDVAPVTLSPTSDSVGAGAETASFNVTVTGAGASNQWTATKTAAWLTIVSPTAPQVGSGTVTYAVAANTGAARTADITVSGKTFTVSQAASATRHGH